MPTAKLHSYKSRQHFFTIIYNPIRNNLQRYTNILCIHYLRTPAQNSNGPTVFFFFVKLILILMYQSRRGEKKIRPNASAYVLQV